MAKILVVEDDTALAGSVKQFLSHQQYTVDVVHDGKLALEHLRSIEYDIVVLDWQLPGMPGIDVCKNFRSVGGQTPIIMLTGLSDIRYKEDGFDSGADDYLTKPFEMKELILRIKALLRRPVLTAGAVLKAGLVTVDTDLRIVRRGTEELHLQPAEYAVLEYMMKNPNKVISPNELASRVWDTDAFPSLDAVYTCINRIRKKIDKNNKEALIRTVHGAGYRLIPPEAADGKNY